MFKSFVVRVQSALHFSGSLQSPVPPDKPCTSSNRNVCSTTAKMRDFLDRWYKKAKVGAGLSHNAQFVSQESAIPERFNDSEHPDSKIFIALFSYTGHTPNELTFNKFDKLVIVDDTSCGPDWWLGYHPNKPEVRGHIPSNFLVTEKVETEEWFFPTISQRSVAEQRLFGDDYPLGTFLIWSHKISGYFLSIRDLDTASLDPYVVHYPIQQNSTTNEFFIIQEGHSFTTLFNLVGHYMTSASGLCHRLTTLCPRPLPTAPPFIPDPEINQSDLKYERDLASGSFGQVYLGVYQNQHQVAVKSLKTGFVTLNALLELATIMRRCRHRNLVSFYAICTKTRPVLIVSEFVEPNGMSLLSILRKHAEEQEKLKVKILIDMALQVASAMEYLESVKVVHGNLAARNCLVGEFGVIKVADAGLVQIIDEAHYIAHFGAKWTKWSAPETVKSPSHFTSKSDVWSFGILLYEIFTLGGTPYPMMNLRNVAEYVFEKGWRMPKPKNVAFPDSIYLTMRQCWVAEPEQRPTFAYLVNYLEQFLDGEDLLNQETVGSIADLKPE